jgi:hypothetical protein
MLELFDLLKQTLVIHMDTETPTFPENTVSPRLKTLVHDSSNRNMWELVGQWFGTDNAILGHVRCLNHYPGKPPEDTIFMLKFLPYKLNADDKALHELRTQAEASRFRLAPNIIDSWTTPTGIAMVMEKMDIDLGDLLTSSKSLAVKNLVIASAISLIRRTHIKGFYHGDVSMSNIMAKASVSPAFAEQPDRYLAPDDPTSEVAAYKALGYRFYFIDFGEGGLLEEPTSIKIIHDYLYLEESLYDLLHDFPGEALRNIYDSLVILIKAFD